MPNLTGRRGVVIFFVVVTILLAVVLTAVMLSLIRNQSRLVHHQVNRIRAYYAGKAAIALTYENFRKGVWGQDATAMRYYCINGKVDSSVTCLDTHTDSNILCDANTPCNVQIGVYPASQPGISGTVKLSIKTDYTMN